MAVSNKMENLMKERARRDAHMNAKFALMEKNRKARANRTPSQQLAELDFRLGQGDGAKRERKMLMAKMQKPKAEEKKE